MDEIMEEEPQEYQMDDAELVRVCKDEAARGYGGADDDNSTISLAMDYYFCRLPGISKKAAKDPDSSRYVSSDVMDVIESTVAEIMPAFTTNEIAFYPPRNIEDEKQAETETAITNYLFLEEYGGYELLQTALRDCLLNGNSTLNAYWDEKTEVEYEDYSGLNEQELYQIMQPNQEDQTVDTIAHEMKEMSVEVFDPRFGQMIQDVKRSYDVKIRRNTMVGKPVIETVKPEDLIVCADHTSPTLYDARFVAQEKIVTVSDLIERGVDADFATSLPAYSDSADNYSRSRSYDETDYGSSSDTTKLVEILECFIKIDYDGDGIAERRKVIIAGDEAIYNEPVTDIEFIGGVTTITPHKYRGISLFERMKQVQDVKTEISRAIIDGTKLAATPRVGVLTSEVNLDDMLTARTGGIVRMSSMNAVQELPNPDVPMSAIQLRQMMDSDRQDSGGSAVRSASQAQTVGNDSAHGIERIMSSMEQSNALLARTLAETLVRGIFIQLHRILRENHKGKVQAKIKGNWIEGMPEQWSKRTDVQIKIGNSQAERQRISRAIANVISFQEKLLAAGSTLTNESKVYTAITDMTSFTGIKDGDRYFVNPQSPEGQQANQAKQQKSQQEQQIQMQVQAEMVKANNMMAEAERVKAQADIQANMVKLENERLSNEVDILKEAANARQKSDELDYKYAELGDKTALELTKLEMENNQEASGEFEENKEVAQ